MAFAQKKKECFYNDQQIKSLVPSLIFLQNILEVPTECFKIYIF
jgi:hypothetical protein